MNLPRYKDMDKGAGFDVKNMVAACDDIRLLLCIICLNSRALSLIS